AAATAPETNSATNRDRPDVMRRLSGFQARTCILNLLLDAGAIDGFAVAVQRPLPCRRGIGEPLLLEAQIAKVLEDDGVVRHLRGGLAERRIGEIEFPLLV